MPTGLHWLLVGGTDYWQEVVIMCGRLGMTNSVTEAQSHAEGRGGKSVTGVHGSVTVAQYKSVTGVWKCSE